MAPPIPHRHRTFGSQLIPPQLLPMPRSDMSDELSAGLRAKALRARLYAAAISDQDASHKLREYADELEAEARTLELDEE